MRTLVVGYLNEGTWREASQQRYPIRTDVESEMTASALPSAHRSICATDPDLEWWRGKEARDYLEAHSDFLRNAAGDEDRIRRVFIVDEEHLLSVRAGGPIDGGDPVKAILTNQVKIGVDVKIVVRPDRRHDCVIYDRCAVRYSDTTPTGGKSVSAKLSTVPSEVGDWQRFFDEAWTQGDDVAVFLEQHGVTSEPDSLSKPTP